MIKVMRISFVLFFSFSVSFAQLSVPFKMRYQGKIKGDMTIIANNIVNRVDYNNSSNNPYYNHTKFSKLNDEFDMEYIDIDGDESTFSSSSAELVFEKKTNRKVIYAALYWSANYKYNIGIQKNEDKFVAQDKDRESFNTIKLKLPNQENYLDVTGQIIFDGIKEYQDFAPYAVYADITNYLKDLSNPEGVYTVANVKATQGKISGGVAAGWTLFVVYEDQTKSEKFISSQDGFAGVYDKPIDVVFSGFEAPSNRNFNVKITGAVLEGDNNIMGDKLLFSSNKTTAFTSLSNGLRPEDNFFNSCISIEDQYFMNRFPDSKNTLGYDSFLYTIPNQNNPVIENTSKEFVLRTQSSGDKCFMFFTALNLDFSPNLATEKKEIIVSNSQENNNQTIKFVPMNNDLVEDDRKTASVLNRIQKNNALGNNLIEIQTLNSSSQPSGYYIMANIFKTEQKTQEFIFYLKTKDITADFFKNQLNNYYYVYLRKLDNQQDAINLYLSKLDNTYKERMQIVSINNDNNLFTEEIKTKENDVVANQKNRIPPKDKIAEVKVNKKEWVLKETQTKNNSTEIRVAQSTENKPSDKGAQSPTEIAKARTLNDLHIANIPDVSKGYYIVTNVFSVTENSTNFIKILKNKGLQPKILINTLNNYKYIYLKRVDTEEEARNILQSKFNNKYDSKMWILSVNNISLLTDNG